MSCLMFVLEYIQIIMTLEEAVQHVVMTAIQEVSPSSVLSETVGMISG